MPYAKSPKKKNIMHVVRVHDDPEAVITEDDLKILDGEEFVPTIDKDSGDEEGSYFEKMKDAVKMFSGDY